MHIILWIIAGLVLLVVLIPTFFLIGLWELGRPDRERIYTEYKNMPFDQLESVVFRYEKSYFEYLGESDPSVVRFAELVRGKNGKAIRKEWGKLSSRFGKIERERGHRGRPFILDYYCEYELALKALDERRYGK